LNHSLHKRKAQHILIQLPRSEKMYIWSATVVLRKGGFDREPVLFSLERFRMEPLYIATWVNHLDPFPQNHWPRPDGKSSSLWDRCDNWFVLDKGVTPNWYIHRGFREIVWLVWHISNYTTERNWGKPYMLQFPSIQISKSNYPNSPHDSAAQIVRKFSLAEDPLM